MLLLLIPITIKLSLMKLLSFSIDALSAESDDESLSSSSEGSSSSESSSSSSSEDEEEGERAESVDSMDESTMDSTTDRCEELLFALVFVPAVIHHHFHSPGGIIAFSVLFLFFSSQRKALLWLSRWDQNRSV